MSTYTGIGSRETPKDVISLMFGIGETLANAGWVLRSGCAPGADSAFEGGAKSAMLIERPKLELYLPWPGFSERGSDGWDYAYIERPQPAAFEIAAEFHPAWSRLTRGVRALHARNVHQILGRNIGQPALPKFVICWTKGAKGGGGTGQALRIARHYDVPIFDLADPAHRKRVEAWLG